MECFELPLSGHGTVDQRVNQYFDTQLQPFVSVLKQADMVLFACHSQGCIVTSLLLEKMVAADMLDTTEQFLGVIAVGGIHHGPYPDQMSDGYSATRELFYLGRPEQPLSQRYLHAVCHLLSTGVKYFVVGSWFDQVVPLFSACLYAIEEPPIATNTSPSPIHVASNLCRAIFVSSELFQHDFLSSLVRLCLHVRNMGHESEVLVHLSGFLRGRLIQRREGAHSVVRSNVDVFGHACQWMLAFRGQPTANPFSVSLRSSALQYGPFFSEVFTHSDHNRFLLYRHVKHLLRLAETLHLDDELQELRTAFASWKPELKTLQQLHQQLLVNFQMTGASKL